MLAVLVAGAAVLRGYRQYLEHRDAALTASAGGGWRVRSALPLDPGPPYSYFGSGLTLMMPCDILEGTEEGFEVAYFTVEAGRRHSGPRIQQAAAIVQLPMTAPTFLYDASENRGGPTVAAALGQRHGEHGGLGPRAIEVLSLARDMVIESAGVAILIRSTGARSEVVSSTAMRLAKAIVADVKGVDQVPRAE